MKYLLDTHLLIWALTEDKKLPKAAYDVINDPGHTIFYSAASVWEIEIKHQKMPDKMPISGEELISFCETAGILSLPVVNDHVLYVKTLHRKEGSPPHNDPFDRILLAQAKYENMLFYP